MQKPGSDVLQFFAEAASQEGVPDSVGAHLDMLAEDGRITRRQWDMMIVQDPRRTAYELQLIYRHFAENGDQPLDEQIFESIQHEGSRYFFERYSPMAALTGRSLD